MSLPRAHDPSPHDPSPHGPSPHGPSPHGPSPHGPAPQTPAAAGTAAAAAPQPQPQPASAQPASPQPASPQPAAAEARVRRGSLSVEATLAAFLEQEALAGLDLQESAFWSGLEALLATFTARNRDLLARREQLQAQIDAWYRGRSGQAQDVAADRAFLEQIGYLVPDGPDFTITTTGVDPEIATIAGPQLVVPVMNARYALNAANARWGSLYDALYGTDAIARHGDTAPDPAGAYAPRRGRAVIAWARDFLDRAAPLAGASHHQALGYHIAGGTLAVRLADGRETGLDPAGGAALAGYQGAATAPTSIYLAHHGLHVQLVIDRSHEIGRDDPAGIADVVLEAAISTIMDGEDSVAAVDGPDKTVIYRNWLGLMRGDLCETVTKAGRSFTRHLAPDRAITRADGTPGTLPGRALMLNRNVGHLMTTPAVLTADGAEAFEGLLDAWVTVVIGLHDRARGPDQPRNSRTGSLYIVKPKMHGPDEVAFADAVFAFVEDRLGLPTGTIKIGVMDEERRTSANLKACIRAAAGRLCFINTGFLDRTGDEIHTAMEAGPVVRKAAMRQATWLQAYEDGNVLTGLACGLPGRAQIGKGMWAMPDRMAEMLATKHAHPEAGASTAWVPSPTAAVLHATHYHGVDVSARQQALAAAAAPPPREALLTLPLAGDVIWTEAEIAQEVDNNCQGILGYVVRWIDAGVGCSKVPDIHDVGLMEDRATCRISSQHLANWLRWGVVSLEQVEAALARMAAVVDRQNAGDPAYRPMAPALDGPAFLAARALVLEGARQPSGYTEPLLHGWRRTAKAQLHAPTSRSQRREGAKRDQE